MFEGRKMTNYNSKQTITVKTNINSIPFVNDLVEQFLDEQGISIKIQMQMNIVIDEILSNIVQYSFREAVGEATITYEYNSETKLLVLAFVDDGVEYNPLGAQDPDITLSAEERDIGGLGVFMVKKIMDEVEYKYEDGCNHFILRKVVEYK